ncbi:MAG: TonB-dependent receptor [Aequorivita sp.]|nr:TonB-dependent receptor [Aequorivita sp.]
MGKTSRKFVLFFSLLFSLSSLAQEKESLASIIATLQKKHNLQFNYAEDLIAEIFLKPPPIDFSLEESLQYLEKNSKLSFAKMSDTLVLVKQKEAGFLCGYIIDKETSKPLASATIQNKNNYAVSDENGFFQLKIENEDKTISIRFLGYKSLDGPLKDFDRNTCGEIFLLPNFLTLPEVMVSNYITTGINKLSDGSFVIDFSDFGILPGVLDNDVLQAVQAFPGIQSINETVSNINIRGGTHDQNLIMWDGIKMYQSGHFFGLISMYNPQITQKVSVLKNGTGVSYTDGVSGTISMQTSEELTTDFNANVGVNLIDANAFADIPIGKKSSVQIAGRKGLSDFFKTPTYNEFFERISQNTEVQNNVGSIINSDKSFDFYDTSLRWIYQISDKDVLRVNFINVSNNLEFNENAFINNEQKSRESSLSQNSIAGAIYYNKQWNDNLQTTFEGYETDYKLKAVNVNVLENQRFKQENVVSETSLKLKMNYRFNEKFNLLGGYQFVETEITNLDDVDDPLFRSLVSEVVRNHSVFSEIDFRSKHNNTNIKGGVRFNYIDKFKKTLWEPRLSFTQRFLEDFTFELLGEFKNQYTSQIINFQNDFLGIEKRRWQLSNSKEIPIIRSKQISAGINFAENGWLLSTEGYYKYVDGITTQSQGFQNQYEFVKFTGSYDVKGLDVLLRKKVKDFNFWLSYSFMDNQYTFTDLQPNAFPSNLDIKHAITLGTAYSLKNLKIAAGFNWHSGKPSTSPVNGNEIMNNEINYAAPNSSQLQNYMRMDVSALYNFNITEKIKADVGVSIWNILDRENEISNYYHFDNEEVIETQQRSLGITPNAGVRVYF